MSNLIGKNLSISTETSDYTQSTENDHFMSGLNLDPLILLNEIYDDTTDNSFISGGFTLTSSGVDSIPNGMAMSHLLPFKHIPHRDPYKEREKMSHHCPINSIVTGYPKYTKEAIIIISQIGAGSTSHVYKCIYMPTLSLVAVSNFKTAYSTMFNKILSFLLLKKNSVVEDHQSFIAKSKDHHRGRVKDAFFYTRKGN